MSDHTVKNTEEKTGSKVLLIVIDGCRPDGIQQASTPTIDALIKKGTHTFSATTISPPITLPAHFSIFSSRKPIGHGVQSNSGQVNISPGTMTIIEAAKYNGCTTASFYSWEPLRNLSPPGALDESHMINTSDLHNGDVLIAEIAAQRITKVVPDFCFAYFEGTDIAGHKSGWMTEDYISAIETADLAVSTLLNTLTNAGLMSEYTVLLLSDHGGNDTHHLENIPEIMTVPLIMSGPGIKKGYCLSKPVSVLDVAPTVASLMGFSAHWEWEGKALFDALL
jgi:arylsulfatase A-like enzyme